MSDEPSGVFIFNQILPAGEITEVMIDSTGTEDTALVMIDGEIFRGRYQKLQVDAAREVEGKQEAS